MPGLVCLICLLVHAARWAMTGDNEAVTGPKADEEMCPFEHRCR